jgi:Rne/Rng family ribonuclease
MSADERVRARILVEGTPGSCRVAILEDGHLVEYYPAAGEGDPTMVGDVFVGRVSKLAPGVEAAFVDVGLDTDAFLPETEWPPEGLNAGQTVTVQVQKDPVGGKGARITCRLALAGRYVVFLPGGERTRMSKRIPEGEERDRLEALGAELLEPWPGDGLIVRTNAQDASDDELRADVERLTRQHRQVLAKARVSKAPARISREPGPAARVVRDHLTEEVEAVMVATQELLEEVRSAATSTPAELMGRIRLETGPFAGANVERALDRALHPKVYLPSGGHVVIEPTEALTSIDVNSGGAKGGPDLETTALETNLEAAAVVARQIRLRDLGGILVVDFIDLIEEVHRERVQASFEAALARDKGNPKVHGWSHLGLMILSRRRRRMPLFRMLTDSCDSCHGTGRVDTGSRVVDRAARATRAYLRKNRGQKVVVKICPDLVEELRERLDDVYGRVSVKGDRGLPPHRYLVEQRVDD